MTLERKLQNVETFHDFDFTARECDNDQYSGVEYTFDMEAEPDGVNVQDIIMAVGEQSDRVIAELYAWGDGTLTVFVVPAEELNRDISHLNGVFFT